MSEVDLSVPADQQEEQFIELICTRGTVLKPGVTLSPGERFQVAVRNAVDGIYPARWWIQTRKAARNAEEFEKFRGEKYDGRKGGQAEPAAPLKDAEKAVADKPDPNDDQADE